MKLPLDFALVTIWAFLRLPFGCGVIVFTSGHDDGFVGTRRARGGIRARIFWCGPLHVESIWDAAMLPRELA